MENQIENNPKVLLLDSSLIKVKLPMTVNIKVMNPEEIEQIRIRKGSNFMVNEFNMVYLSGLKFNLNTVLIRGPNSQILDEAQRALNDCLQVLKRTLESKSILPGGGSGECCLSFLLEEFSLKIHCKELVYIHRFSMRLY